MTLPNDRPDDAQQLAAQFFILDQLLDVNGISNEGLLWLRQYLRNDGMVRVSALAGPNLALVRANVLDRVARTVVARIADNPDEARAYLLTVGDMLPDSAPDDLSGLGG